MNTDRSVKVKDIVEKFPRINILKKIQKYFTIKALIKLYTKYKEDCCLLVMTCLVLVWAAVISGGNYAFTCTCKDKSGT